MAGEERRLCIYLNEGDRRGGRPLWEVVLEFLKSEGCSGATVFRGVAGYGGHRSIHTANLADLPANLPILIDLIDRADRIEALLPRLDQLVPEGLITLQDVSIYKYTYLREQPLSGYVTVDTAMTPASQLVTVQPATSLYEAVMLLVNRPFGTLPVVDQTGKVVGIVTDGDLFNKGGAPFRLDHLQAMASDHELLTRTLAGLKSSNKTVGEIMTSPVATVKIGENLLEAGKKMRATHLKRFPVVDSEGKLAGLLSRLDILRATAHINQSANSQEEEHAALLHLNADTPVDQVMTRRFPVVSQEAPLSEALAKMMELRQHRAVVTDGQGKVVGIVTERDMITRASAQVRPHLLQGLRRKLGLGGNEEQFSDLATLRVSEVMSDHPYSIPAGSTVAEAVRIMEHDKIKFLPVLDNEGHSVGILTRSGILKALLEAEN